VLVHDDKNCRVDEEVGHIFLVFTGTALNFRLPLASAVISLFVPVRNVQRLKSALKRWPYFFSTAGESNSGSVVSVTSLAALSDGRRFWSERIWPVMRGHGPAQRVKTMSATQT